MRYVDDWLIQLSVLSSPELEISMNMPSHNLQKSELTTLLYQLFESGLLVAKKECRGYFTPSLLELENALDEPVIGMPEWNSAEETFYGMTSATIERYRKLKILWGSDLDIQS